MKCPNCGAQIGDGHLYCEYCGREIQIVPEFEPEIENSIHATLSGVATEINDTTAAKNGKDSLPPAQKRLRPPGKRTKRGTKKKHTFGSKRRLLLVTGAAFLLLCLGIGTLSLLPEYHYRRGLTALEKGSYEMAILRFSRAVSLSGENTAFLNGLANAYYLDGQLPLAEEVCLEILTLEADNAQAYDRLLSIYGDTKAYEKAAVLLQDCPNPDIPQKYPDYLASPPAFDIAGGTYQEKISVKLMANAAGTIYYTTDGSEPDEESTVYTTPIPMESGAYTIKAFYRNPYGVCSSVVTEAYYLDVELPKPPVVEPASGTYTHPEQITVEVPDGCSVYYTTDQTMPDASSSLYTGPFWMPTGHSTLQFVTITPGEVSGEITERRYTLDLRPVLSIEAASNQLILSLKNAGIILNLHGMLPQKKGHNIYTYKYALTIQDNHYFLYREYYEESAGTSNATGNDYVVNYMTGECYRACLQEDDTYRLLTIEPAAANP